MDKSICVTVLMPTLNAAKYLEEALNSIVVSTLPSIGTEVLVLDGGSTDDTHRIVRAYEPLTRLSVKQDGSMYEALNRGLSEARGDIIGWLNADDIYDAQGPGKLVAALQADASLDLVYGDYMHQEEDLKRFMPMLQSDHVFDDMHKIPPIASGFPATISTFWRASSLRSFGGWDASYRMAADWELMIRVANREPPIRALHVPCIVGYFRIHPGSMTMGGRHANALHQEMLRMWDEALCCKELPNGLRAHLQARRKVTLMDGLWCQVKRRNIIETKHWARLLTETNEAWGREFVSRVWNREARIWARTCLSPDMHRRLRSVYHQRIRPLFEQS